MCVNPSVPKPQQWQASQEPVRNESTEDDESRRRGRRGTILATAMGSQAGAATAPAGGKQLLGQ